MGIAAAPEGTNRALNPNNSNDQSQYEFDLSDGYYATRNNFSTKKTTMYQNMNLPILESGILLICLMLVPLKVKG